MAVTRLQGLLHVAHAGEPPKRAWDGRYGPYAEVCKAVNNPIWDALGDGGLANVTRRALARTVASW